MNISPSQIYEAQKLLKLKIVPKGM
jgi:hypothetical protein